MNRGIGSSLGHKRPTPQDIMFMSLPEERKINILALAGVAQRLSDVSCTKWLPVPFPVRAYGGRGCRLHPQ